MSDLLAYMDRIVLPYAPRMILVYEGDNDLAGGRSPKEIADGFEEFARRVHRKLPRTHVAFLAIKPSIRRERLMGAAAQTNERVARFCTSRNWLSYIDVFTPMLDEQGRPRPELFVSDNLHLNEQGYRRWAEIVRPHLAILVGRCRGRPNHGTVEFSGRRSVGEACRARGRMAGDGSIPGNGFDSRNVARRMPGGSCCRISSCRFGSFFSWPSSWGCAGWWAGWLV
jgi:hypothetical protein